MEKSGGTLGFLSSNIDIKPIILKVSIIIIATIAVFHQDLGIVFNDALTSEINNFILVVPFIFVFLIYRKRRMLHATISTQDQHLVKETQHLSLITGILLFTVSIFSYWRGSYTVTPLEIHMLSLPLFLAGLILILYNFQTLKQMVFPLIFLLFLTPPPAEILYQIGSTLSVISSQVSFNIVNALGIPSSLTIEYGNPTIQIIRSNNEIIPFSVDIACSGVYGLIGFVIFAAFLAYMIRDKIHKKITIFMIGLPLIYGLNIIRITFILLIGYQFGGDIALEIFHLLGGWVLIFLGTLLLLVVSEKIFHIELFKKIKEQCSKCNNLLEVKQDFCLYCGKIIKFNPIKISKNDWIKVFGIILVIVFILSIQVPIFALTEGGTIEYSSPSGQQLFTEILPEIEGYTLEYRDRDYNYEQLVMQDLAVWYYYNPVNRSDRQTILFHVGLEIAQTWSSMHSLYYCLHEQPIIDYGQPKVNTFEYKDVRLMENPPILGKYFAFEYEENGQLETAIWWYETPIFSINSTSRQKIARITLIAYPNSEEELPIIENQLLGYAKEIANYWEPIKLWSPVALLLSQNVDVLVVIVIGILLVIIAFYFFAKRKEQKRLFRIYNKLSETNKQTFKTISKTERSTTPTLNNIFFNLQNVVKIPINKDTLLQELSNLEKTGLLKRTISNKNDEPIVVWKTQI